MSAPPPDRGIYIRFGDWPTDERSANWMRGGHEEGVSVYEMHGPLANPKTPDGLRDDVGKNERARMALFEERANKTHEASYPGRRGHFVRGTRVGTGQDGEPLLRDVQHVGAWPQHAHRFVPGEQGTLF